MSSLVDSLTQSSCPAPIESCFGSLERQTGIGPPSLLLQVRDLSQVSFRSLMTMGLLDGKPQRATDQNNREQHSGPE